MTDSAQDFWNESYKEDASQVIVPDLVLDAEIQALPIGHALDLGCGSGENALKLAARGWSVVGLDWADHAIELAQRVAQEQGLDAMFAVADLTTWQPLPQFDLVISTYSLPSGEAGKQILANAAAALRVGGTLLVVEWDRSMAAIWGVAEDEFLTPSQIVAWLPSLVVEKAEVRRFEKMFAPDDMRASQGAAAFVAVVRARKE